MSYFDAKAVLVDALKEDPDLFQLSNLILPKAGSIKAVYKLEEIMSLMYEFAKNPEVGLQMLGAPPKKPDVKSMHTEDADNAIAEYQELLKSYEQQKKALTMHVSVEDMISIENFCSKFTKSLHATSAIKGNRFYAFTKNAEQEEPGMLDFLKGVGGNKQQ